MDFVVDDEEAVVIAVGKLNELDFGMGKICSGSLLGDISSILLKISSILSSVSC